MMDFIIEGILKVEIKNSIFVSKRVALQFLSIPISDTNQGLKKSMWLTPQYKEEPTEVEENDG